jgi:hypothetical protein
VTTPSLPGKRLPEPRSSEPRTSEQRSLAQVFASLPALGFLPLVFLLAFLLPTFSSQRGLLAAPDSKAKPYALIAGTVWGPDDRPVYGVPVKIRRATDKPKKSRWEVYSDHMGEFAQRVPTGDADYILSADLKGFKTVDGRPLRLVKEVTVHIYQDEREDTGLHLTINEDGVKQSGAAGP